MPRHDDPINAAAEYISVQLHPEEIRCDFVRNIRVHYHATEIVYVLQELSNGMAGLFVGLLGSYLYDKTKKPDQKLDNVEALLLKQQKKLAELETLILKEKDKKFAVIAQQHVDTHKRTIGLIQDSDPYVSRLMETALSELEARGQKSLTDEVDSYYYR